MNENEFEIPPGYGAVGAPSFDQISHAVDQPFNAQPPYAVEMEYGTPGFDQTSHFVQSPYNAQPPYAVQMDYAAPGFDQTSHFVQPPYNAQPPYAVQMGYGDAPFSAAGAHPQVGMPYSTAKGTFTFRSDGTVDGTVSGQSVTYAAGSREARQAVDAALVSVGETPVSSTGQRVFDTIEGIVNVFIPSGKDDKSPASNTPPPAAGFPWTTVAWVGGGLLILGVGGYFLLRKKED